MSANESELPRDPTSVDSRIKNAHDQLQLAAERADDAWTVAALLEVCADLETLSGREFTPASELPVLEELQGDGETIVTDGGTDRCGGGIERFLSCPECDSEDISYRVNNGRLVLTCEDCLETTSKLVGRATFR